MANTTERPTVPAIISVRMSQADLDLAADLVEWTGITEGTQLLRYGLRAAHREMSEVVAKSRAPKPINEG